MVEIFRVNIYNVVIFYSKIVSKKYLKKVMTSIIALNDENRIF